MFGDEPDRFFCSHPIAIIKSRQVHRARVPPQSAFAAQVEVDVEITHRQLAQRAIHRLPITAAGEIGFCYRAPMAAHFKNRDDVVGNLGNVGRAASEKLGGIIMAARKFKILDVRPILAKGVEPLSKIRDNIEALGPDEGLSVIAPFLPSPLIEKLGSEGFESRVERQVGGGWAVHFWRDR